MVRPWPSCPAGVSLSWRIRHIEDTSLSAGDRHHQQVRHHTRPSGYQLGVRPLRGILLRGLDTNAQCDRLRLDELLIELVLQTPQTRIVLINTSAICGPNGLFELARLFHHSRQHTLSD